MVPKGSEGVSGRESSHVKLFAVGCRSAMEFASIVGGCSCGYEKFVAVSDGLSGFAFQRRGVLASENAVW